MKLMEVNGVRTLCFKRLAPNDNSKNQLYLGSDYATLQTLPFEEVIADKSRKDAKRDRFKARIRLSWMDDAGALFKAPNAQIILYPKYPEVRLSSFLQGAAKAPSIYLTSRKPGRVLFLGITGDRRIIGHVVGPDNPVARELDAFDGHLAEGVFSFVFKTEISEDTRAQLLSRLREISDLGWVNSCKLHTDGTRAPYSARNGGGFTLEALLGIPPNSENEPDFLGWEIKQHAGSTLDKPLSGNPVTLITPEPTGGIYRTDGVIPFVRQFGYPDKRGRPDRMNFGGVHRYNQVTELTGLRLDLIGFDLATGRIENVDGGIALLSIDNTIAALWDFSTLLEKWNRKHARAAYIPSKSHMSGAGRQYRYGWVVALGEGTDFAMFLGAIVEGNVYYDPGIKVENASTAKPSCKRRSQFRVKPADLPSLYHSMNTIDLRQV